MKKTYWTLTALLSILLFGAAFIWHSGPGPFFAPRHMHFEDPQQAVIDARAIIAKISSDSSQEGQWLYAKDLPKSLRIPRLRYAIVFRDHLSLVLSRNPDWNVGARIWIGQTQRQHHDTPTKYKEIYFYDYTNDSPESPYNIK